MELKQASLANFIDKFARGSGAPFYSTVNHMFANLSSNDVMVNSLADVHCKAFRDHLGVGEEHEERKHLPHYFPVCVVYRYSVIVALLADGEGLKPEDYQPGSGQSEAK
jgi:hypothetical protein